MLRGEGLVFSLLSWCSGVLVFLQISSAFALVFGCLGVFSRIGLYGPQDLKQIVSLTIGAVLWVECRKINSMRVTIVRNMSVNTL